MKFNPCKDNYINIKFLSNTLKCTALNGNLENMKWLKENGCPISDYTKHKVEI